MSNSRVDSILNPRLYVGRAPQQVLDFIEEEVQPILTENISLLNIKKIDLKV